MATGSMTNVAAGMTQYGICAITTTVTLWQLRNYDCSANNEPVLKLRLERHVITAK